MLNNIGLPGLLLIAIVVVLLFGRGKISQLMGDVAKGIKAFRKGMSEDEIEPHKVEQAADAARDVTPDAEQNKTNA
ncbi:MAG: twin-arginine translocase TatA/TatE family subunit [Pseudomonadota bacterium]